MSTFMFLALAGVFVSVALFAGSIASLALSRNTAEHRRLRQVARGPKTPELLPELMPLSAEMDEGGLEALTRFLPKSRKELSKLRLRLARGGVRHPAGPVIFSLAELLLPVLLGGIPALLLEGPQRWLGAVVGALIGYVGPSLVVDRWTKKRQKEIENGLPDALDLLVVCIEAGSGLDQAIMRCAEELVVAYPVLGEELRVLNVEIRAGKSRLDAFKNLAARTKVDDVRALVAMLIQTDRFGTSIGLALRTHAETSRAKRRQRAEEAAAKIGVKLVFPLVLFFFPAFYVVVLGPAIIQFSRTFFK